MKQSKEYYIIALILIAICIAGITICTLELLENPNKVEVTNKE